MLCYYQKRLHRKYVHTSEGILCKWMEKFEMKQIKSRENITNRDYNKIINVHCITCTDNSLYFVTPELWIELQNLTSPELTLVKF